MPEEIGRRKHLDALTQNCGEVGLIAGDQAFRPAGKGNFKKGFIVRIRKRAFLLFLLPKHDASLRKQAHNPKRLHVIDTGLVAAFAAFPDRDAGRKLETAVFPENRRRRNNLFCCIGGGEADLCYKSDRPVR